MADNPPITVKFLDYVTPSLNIDKLILNLEKRIDFTEKYLESQAKNEFEGELIFRVIGNKPTTTVVTPTIDDLTPIDINHAVADPFRDDDVDRARINSRGIIDRDMIEKRNIFYLQNTQLANILFLTTTEELRENLATFLIRISHKGDDQPNIDKGSNIKFSFREPFSMRNPYIIISKEKNQSKPAEASQK